MLSISSPITSSAAVRYYIDLTNEDYMTQGGEPIGTWFGQSAEKLGLTGKVNPESFKAVMAGFSPDPSKPLVQNAGEKDRQRGWDLTFSAPKSVSVLYSQGDPWIREQVEAAHRAAVISTLEYLEQNALWTRRGHAGAFRESVGMCAALFPHPTSRAGDPQVHIHVVIASVCVRDDGTTGSILSKPLFVHKMVAGALYRAALGTELIARLGVELTQRGRHGFEVAGVVGSLTRAFSKRRDQVLRRLAERGESGPEAARRATLASRPPKEHLPRRDLFAMWEAVGRGVGWSTAQAQALLGKRSLPVGPIPARDIVKAVKHLSQYQAHFTCRDVVRALADEVQSKGFRVGQIQEAARAILPKLIRLGQLHGEDQFTTKATLRMEREFFARVVAGRDSNRHLVSARFVGTHLGTRPLSDEQKAAVLHITTTPGAVKVVSGLAGTGKSTMLATAREVWEKSGYTVIGVSLTGKAAESLTQSAGIKSYTLASVLWQMNEPIVSVAGVTLARTSTPLAPKAPAWSPVHGLKLPHLTFGVGGVDGKKISSKTIVVVNEAGLVGTRQMADLVDRLTAARAKVILVGDRRQNPPIEAGAPFESLATRVSHATLKDIQRQNEPWAREMVKDLAVGNVRKALDELNGRGRIHVLQNKEETVSRWVDDWRRSGPPRDNLILASTREEVSALNKAAQEKREQCGELSKSYVEHRDQKFHVGDRVIFDANSSRLKVNNGTLGEVLRASGDDLVVRLDSGTRVTVPLDRYPHVSLGYALTGHRAQGITCENSFSLVSGDFMGREMGYVQASRARAEAHLYLDRVTAGVDLKGLEELFRPGRLKAMAHDILQFNEPKSFGATDTDADKRERQVQERSLPKTEPKQRDQEKQKSDDKRRERAERAEAKQREEEIKRCEAELQRRQ
ncbi:MAG TPA: hypothetical protein DCE44_13670, partial [Verrucomicrobiales bacterium]|nr:hypothetical protein [Verrucomicrobiales bacterium]